MPRTSLNSPRALRAVVVLAVLAGLPRAVAAQKMDTLLLSNGDRIIGEVSSLANGLLTYKTDNIGTITVKWNRVVKLTSPLYFEVETRYGQRLYGTLAHMDSTDYLAVSAGTVDTLLLFDVVEITRIKRSSFFDRIDGYLDLGFSYAKANETVQLSSGLQAAYLNENWGMYLKGDLFVQSQEGAGRTRRWSIQPSVRLQQQHRMMFYTLGQLQENEELDLKLRTLISPGAGLELFRTNAHQANVFLGLAAQHEWYTDATAPGGETETNNLEVAIAGEYHAFKYDSPELDFSAAFEVYPSVSDWGRVRNEGDLRARYEALKDFFITLAFLLSYDSRPPSADIPKSDFTTTLSLSWKF